MQIDFSADGFDFATSVGYERAVGDGEPIVLCGVPLVVEIVGEGGDSSETWTFTMRWQRKAEGIKAREAMASKRYVSKRVMRDEDEGSWGWGSE